MSTIHFQTSSQTFRQLMGNGLSYQVPRFQRNYSWTDVEWEDLWLDIEEVVDGQQAVGHYMGYLVLQSRDHKSFTVIDDQQRLTTLSLLVLALLGILKNWIEDQVEPDRNIQRQQQLRNSYLGYLDPVTLVPHAKLRLNRTDNEFYKNSLLPLERLPSRHGRKPSAKRLLDAFVYFQAAFSKRMDNRRDGAALAQFLEKMSDRLFFTVIIVTDELNAYQVFETLNARGVKLSSTDLLKNYLFSLIHQQDDRELDALEERWEILIGNLGNEDFPRFLRTHWNSRHAFVRQTELFKSIKPQIRDRGQAFALVREMEADAVVYQALSDPEDRLWEELPDTERIRRRIQELRMFSVRQVVPLLLAGYRNLEPEGFLSLLDACTIISFRYNVISNRSPSEQERTYARLAIEIEQGRKTTIAEILHGLRPVYPTDQEFEHDFRHKSLKTTNSRNKKIVRYILHTLESHASGNRFDSTAPEISIEHILPVHGGTA